VLVGAQTITVDAEERFVGVTPPLATTEGYLDHAAETIATGHPLAAASAVVARRAYEAVGGFDPQLGHTNDWEMWTRLASFGPVAWIDEPLALYRSHAGSDSNRVHRTTAYLDECLEAVARFSTYFDEGSRAAVVEGARHAIGGYGIAVALDLVGRRERKLAVRNAARAVRIDPTIHTSCQALEVLARAIATATQDRVHRLRPRGPATGA
jgi:hypothetical protein